LNTITPRLSLILLLCVAFTDSEAQRGPQDTAMPEKVATQTALFTDPLDAPTNHCNFKAPLNQHIKLDYSQVAANRRLRREAYRDTDIRALKPGSQHWVTGCPVALERGVQGTPVCKPINVFQPANGQSELRIAQVGNQLVFKIDNTARGTIRGKLRRVGNPHGRPEEVWLQSHDVTRNGVAESYTYYVFMQDRDTLKYYQVEAFDPATLCMDAASKPNVCVKRTAGPPQTTGSTVARDSASSTANAVAAGRSAADASGAKGGEGTLENATTVGKTPGVRLPGAKKNKRDKQTDTGGGHEPPPVDN
jgi:hypothetical protein